MTPTQYIPDLVGAVVQKVSDAFPDMPVYYAFGHHQAVVKVLTDKDGNPEKPAKYPLIWLVTPFDENRGGIYDSYATVPELHFVIAYDTNMNYTMEERRDNVFLPILYPVYSELLRQFRRSLSFSFGGPEPVHRKTDLQYARVSSTGENLLNDFVDVIDLKLLDVTVKNIC